MPSRLYVGNLAYSVSGDDLQELFSQAGEVQNATVITDKFSGQSKGFGFVEMSSSGDAATAIQRFNDQRGVVRVVKGMERCCTGGQDRGQGRQGQ